MTDPSALVDRLAALPQLADIPREELEWIVAHGEFEAHPAGTIVARKGERMPYLYILLSGHMTSQAERRGGLRWVADLRTGDVTGLLPYSRTKGPPGDVYFVVDAEALKVHERHLAEMVHRCPAFTAHTVHHMIDRVRYHLASELQDEKLVSLGKLAAGLAHELNNPASAALRCAAHLPAVQAEADAASRALGAVGLTEAMMACIERVRVAGAAREGGAARSPIEQSDREDAFAGWIARHGMDQALVEPLATSEVTLAGLDELAGALPAPALAPALRWIGATCANAALAADIQQATSRINDLVASVKRFTYMDSPTGLEPVDVCDGLRETIRLLAPKARTRQAEVSLDIAPDLPRARAIGSELNQVWMNLLDNALDAVSAPGHVVVSVRPEHERVVVRVVDDGPGIAPDVLPRVFDQFFTTKPPGQGTGLGLAISERLVRQSFGDIAVQSRPGRTEFRVSLPAAG